MVLELLRGLGSKSPKGVLGQLNYYTSPELFLDLYKNGENACGTARHNRKYFPKDLVVHKNVEMGYLDCRSNGPILATVWKDKGVF